MSYGSYVPPLIAANGKTYKSKMTDYKGISESTGYPYIKTDEKWDNIVEDPFEDEGVEAEDNTLVYIAIDSDSSSSDENENIGTRCGEPNDIEDDSSDGDESQREGEGENDGDINVIDTDEVKDDFSARSRARAETLWGELDDEARQSLMDQNLTATDYYSIATKGEYATDNAVRAGLILLSKNNGNSDNYLRNINVLTDTMALQQINEVPPMPNNAATAVFNFSSHYYAAGSVDEPVYFDTLNHGRLNRESKAFRQLFPSSDEIPMVHCTQQR